MAVLLTGISNSYTQLITVLLVFVVILGITAWTTKWIANYQKQQGVNCNIEVIETARVSNGKYLQIVRVGKTYKVIAVCKDTVTMLGDIPEEQLEKNNVSAGGMKFSELLNKMMNKDSGNTNEPKE